ncbi:HEPN domain-containing protein [Mycetocola sp.]|uniref:HEPN domain-containing protein n=1 Tax=Mycetocola sp. TaxID=1871042 RepID=UPI00398918E8
MAEVDRRYKRLKAVFAGIDGQGLTSELLAHYAKYLCVLVAGFAEQSVKELVSEYARVQSSERVHRYVAGQLKLVWGLDTVKLQRIVEAMDPTWWAELKAARPEELESLASVASVRNLIAHGQDTGITIGTITNYFEDVNKLVRHLSTLLGDPTGTY